MGDARLRDLERCYRESGAEDDLERWLVERLRAGELDRDRLRVAADLGSAAAARAIDAPVPPAVGRFSPRLVDLDVELVLRIYAAAARGRLEEQLARPGVAPATEGWPKDYRVAVEAAEEQVVCPCEGHVALAISAAVELQKGRHRPFGEALLTIRRAARAAVARERRAVLALRPRFRPGDRSAVRNDVVPWLLGVGDPLRARVVGRRAARG